MMEIPNWWLVLSGIFFAINICFFLVLTIILVMLTKMVMGMKPKIESLESSIQTLIAKVTSIAEKVDELTATVKETVSKISVNVQNVGGSAEIVARTAGNQAGKISPLIVGAITTMRIAKAIGDLRTKKRFQDDAKTVKKKSSNKLGTVLAVASHFLRR